MTIPDSVPERLSLKSNEVYIEFLTQNLGASREEVLDVVRRSGISARRISEYLVRQQAEPNRLKKYYSAPRFVD